jgi:cbb3-type cytochrome oxidase subunit 3
MKSAGLAGAVFLTVIVIAVLFFAYKSGKGTMILKKS